MLKTFFAASILGYAIAMSDGGMEGDIKEGAMLGTATSGDITSSGMIHEWKGTIMDKSLELMAQTLIMGWETKNEKAPFTDNSWIQNWAQWEDPENTGKFLQMTCNVKFDSSKSMAAKADVTVRNAYGATIDATVTTGAWNTIGTLDTMKWSAGTGKEEFAWNPCPDDNEEMWEECYKTTSSPTMSSQICTANIILNLQAEG